MAISNRSARFLFDILELLGAADRPLSLTEIRRSLDLAAATAHRGLATLEQAGFAERYQASTRYVLGAAGRRLRQTFVARFAARDRALPHLRRLSVATGETVSMSMRVGWFAVRIAVVTGSGAAVRRTAPIGEMRRLDEGLAGRAMLALLPARDLAAFESYCRGAGPPCAAGPPGEFAATRNRGYAIEAVPGEPESAAIAVPLRGRDNRVAAAIAVEGPAAGAAAGAGETLPEWRALVQELERALTPVENHYAHLDPARITPPISNLHSSDS